MNLRAVSVTFSRPHTTIEWERLAYVVEFRPRELARECGVSLRTLQRLFRNRYEMALSEWLRDVRMREAYSRLRNGHRIKEVAYSLGFKQLSHFSREFKKHFGMNPRQFRQLTFGEIDSDVPPLSSSQSFPGGFVNVSDVSNVNTLLDLALKGDRNGIISATEPLQLANLFWHPPMVAQMR